MVYRLGDFATSIMLEIINLHSDLFFIILIIVFLVGYILSEIIFFFSRWLVPVKGDLKHYSFSILEARLGVFFTSKIMHGKLIEIVWTLFPAIVLISIAIPSLTLLYKMDDVYNPLMTIKVIGNQWYWSYEYTGDEDRMLQFDSYMLAEDSLFIGDYRLLEVDREVWVPVNVPVRVIVTASDVIHSWALPLAGIKIDAVPGRLNQVLLLLEREGVLHGQCSEICGVNHGFMPIVVNSSSYKLFNNWLSLLDQ